MPTDKKHDTNSLGMLPRSRSGQPISWARVFMLLLIAAILLAFGLQMLSLIGPLEVFKWFERISRGDQSQPQPSHNHLKSEHNVNITTPTAMFYENCDATTIGTGSYDARWWSDNLPKSINYPFQYNRNQKEFSVSNNFHRLLYASDKKDRIHTDLTWEDLQDRQNLGPIGDKTVTHNSARPTDVPYVSRPSMPRWYPTELGYRTTAVWRAILTVAIEQKVQDPVTQYMNTQVPNLKGDRVQTALFPSKVRELIFANSAKIHGGGSARTWVGTKKMIEGDHSPPFPNIEVGYDKRITTWQRGVVGPLSIEAAFILATQVAGVNFKAVASTVQASKHVDAWWFGVLMPTKKGRQTMCLNEEDYDSGGRLYGRYQRSGVNGQHDKRAGVYVAFDLDPMEEDTAMDHNVFVFIIQALDGYSTFKVEKDAYLRNVDISRYKPSQGDTDAKFWGPKGPMTDPPPLPKATKTANTRQVAHAHAGSMKRSKFMSWLHSKSHEEPFPSYTQLSLLHMYVLTEDWDLEKGEKMSDWPRKNWLHAQP